MTHKELEQHIRQYIASEVRNSKEKAIVEKLFLGPEPGSFINQFDEFDGDIGKAVAESVKSVASDKQAAIDRYNKLIDYVNEDKAKTEQITVDWPPIDVSNGFERMVYILKVLQDEQYILKETKKYQSLQGNEGVVQFLSDKLWISTRSIEGDLSAIQKDSIGNRSLFGQSFNIAGIERAGYNITFKSTVHPIFLLENLTGIAVQLQALLEKATQPLFREWAMETAERIWQQLTGYAKGHIEKFFLRYYPEGSPELELFSELKKAHIQEEFKIEEDVMDKNPVSQLMYGWKAWNRCIIRYKEGEQIVDYTGTLHSDFPPEDRVQLILDSGEVKEILFNNVVFCRESE